MSNYDLVRDGRNGDQAVLRRLFKVEHRLFGNISKNYDIAIANGVRQLRLYFWSIPMATTPLVPCAVFHSGPGSLGC